MNDQETLLWARERALEYLDAQRGPGAPSTTGSLAITSLISDLGKHPALGDLRQHAVMTSPFSGTDDEIRAWVREITSIDSAL